MAIKRNRPSTTAGGRRPGVALKLLRTVGILAIAGGLGAFGTLASFSATTSSSGNETQSGTVAISDTDGGSAALYSATSGKPGDAVSSCIRVTYTGSLKASVRVHVSAGIADGGAFDVEVERGSGLAAPSAAMSCTGFTASSVAFDGSLASFPTTYAAGVDAKSGGAWWAQDDSVDYRITITVNDDTTPNAHTSPRATGGHTFTWEARNGSFNHLDADTEGLKDRLGHWAPWYSTSVARTTQQARTGYGSLGVSITGPYGWGVTLDNWPGFVATPGDKRIQFWGRLGTGSGLAASMRVKWRDGAGTVLQTDVVTIPALSSAWQLATADVVAPAGTTRVFVELYGGSGVAGDSLYVDDVFVGAGS
ncbi:MAG: hypothetical protein ACR2L8_05365 [Solirubrobacteraceae bacterium]